MSNRIYRVQVQRDHLNKVASSTPEKAIAELIWNALDAEATRVEVEFIRNELGTEKIVVSDNGWGFPLQHAEGLFGSLGGSWKAGRAKTANSREMHGRQGQGRLKPLSLGRCVEWSVKHRVGHGAADAFHLTQFADNLQEFSLDDELCLHPHVTGVSVFISELFREERFFDPQEAAAKLLPIFALYLRNYSDTQIYVDGVALNPNLLIKNTVNFDLGEIVHQGVAYPVNLKVVEWQGKSGRELWFCTAQGFPLEKCSRKARYTGHFEYTAYLQTELVDVLNQSGLVGLGDLNDSLREITDRALNQIQHYFAQRNEEQAQQKIDAWKQDAVYPYHSEPATSAEKAQRQLFDTVALKLAGNIKTLNSNDKKSLAFQLRLLRYMFDHNPNDLTAIMADLMEVPAGAQLDLTGVLGRV